MIADEVERPAQSRLGQGRSVRLLGSFSNRSSAPCVVQRELEFSVARKEHRQRTKHSNLAEDVAACFSNCQASVQSRTRRVAWPIHVHRRNSEVRLKLHLLRSTTGRIAERDDCALRPPIAFG